ncbi:hypothetical protein [Cyanobium sp. PCC 7001]|uniref:hypothetical protein n=1 Tax=Cyanobium sp. PCC 7001 TaxID=180281 RepID=UPI00030EF6CA|nr:hypothetical protein [Cyanobium sp. PCC 7001]
MWFAPTALFLFGTLLSPAAGRAQMLLDATGAAAMQGTVNSISVPGSTAILNRARETTSEIQNVQGGGAAPAQPPPAAGSPAPAAPAGAGTASSRGPQPPAQSTARVNGRSVPMCSHGGLCHGALLRAMGIR